MNLPLDTKRVKQGELFFSNHLEVLVELLIEQIIGKDPFGIPKIIIPSREMGRWIKRAIADRLGVAANIQTLFFSEALQKPLPSKLELTRQIYPKISDLEYVQKDDRRRMLLAQTLAGFFGRYLLYGVPFENDWQKKLWDSLALKIELIPKGKFHIFAFSHIPEALFNCFCDSIFYQLSPCEEFWSDLSKRSSPFALLSSCGKVGRKFAAMVEESGIETSPYYLPPDGTSALHELQRSMLSLVPKKIKADESVAVHLVSTRMREIEILHHELMKMDIEPKDVLIMAPDISLYKPYIEAIFEAYQIADMPAGLNSQVKGLQLLLELEKKRYSAPAFLELFRHPLFYRRWSESDLEQIRHWIVASGIRWGIDGEYRKSLLGKFEEGATFESGFDQLLESLAVGDLVSFTEAELLGEWIESVRAIYAKRPSGIKSMSAWVDYLRALCADFFIPSDDQLWLFAKLDNLRFAEEMPFDAFYLLLEEELKGEGLTIHPNELQAYRFSSMLPMRSIPAKVVWLLGMDQESFPRVDRWLSFDLSRKSYSYSPSRVDFDRYLFLESILSAREKFIVSMVGRDPIDNQEKAPSSCVSDLLDHLEITFKEHPAMGYEEPLTQHDYQMALACAKKEMVEVPFAIRILEQPLQNEVIDISKLLRLSRSPLKHYFEHQLGLHFFEEEKVKEEEEFILSPLAMTKIRSDALKSSLERALQNAKKRPGYPLGLFGKIADAKCETIEEKKTNSIEWHEHITKPTQIDETLWYYPAIKSGPVTIVGRVDAVIDGCLYIQKKAELRTLLSNWPLLLIFDEVQFLDKKISIKSPLERYLGYFFEARTSASPLFPTWIKPIIKSDAKQLQEEMQKPSFDQSWLWSSSGRVFVPKKIIETWKPKAEFLFSEALDEWF